MLGAIRFASRSLSAATLKALVDDVMPLVTVCTF
jgi:hypothetical protein